MRALLVNGSRADYGAIEAVYTALKRHDVSVVLMGPDIGHITDEFDLAVVEGDRFEVLRATVELFLQKIPIVHLGGGDITEGSQDDSMRHAITKLSHLHFTTTQEAANRIIQMGEEPWRVKVVGEPGLDNIRTHENEIATQLAGAEDYILVVWHPNTLVSEVQAISELTEILVGLNGMNIRKLVIGPNFDAGHEGIRGELKSWCSFQGQTYVDSLPRDQYLTVLKHAKCLVGNSSSGYYEAPSFGTPVVDIGDRQKGRTRPSNVIHCRLSHDNIYLGIKDALKMQKTKVVNPYFTGNAAEMIAAEIASIENPQKLLLKRFCDIK